MTLDEFNSFFRISGEIEKELWKKAAFVFDTSSILEIYYYSEQTRQQICTKLFSNLKDRLWLANHTCYEYLKNRESVIRKVYSEKYSGLKKEQINPIDECINVLKTRIQEIKQKTGNEHIHPFIDQNLFDPVYKTIDSLKTEFENFQKEFDKEIKKRGVELKRLEEDDDVYHQSQNALRLLKSMILQESII
ncbi:hypothetical protein A3860_02125 [Niastella vici]|uniref:PIN like domain-containing protein n=1 Tax=Niastella vici TaxID=1703345 RepID=A0A1V9G9E0_9BACT|nr:hypothetical protein A3860_02125 [Niastella vici]